MELAQAASDKRRAQLELLALNVPEIGARGDPVKRLQLVIQMVDQPPACARAVMREVGVARARVVALERSVSAEKMQELERACLT